MQREVGESGGWMYKGNEGYEGKVFLLTLLLYRCCVSLMCTCTLLLHTASLLLILNIDKANRCVSEKYIMSAI